MAAAFRLLPAAVKLRSMPQQTGVNGGSPSEVSEKKKKKFTDQTALVTRYYLIKGPGTYIHTYIVYLICRLKESQLWADVDLHLTKSNYSLLQ